MIDLSATTQQVTMSLFAFMELLDIDEQELMLAPELQAGDIVQFEPFYQADLGGIGTIKSIIEWEFKNPEYDASDPDSELFITLETAIVESLAPDENWVDYVPLHCIVELLSAEEAGEAYEEYKMEQEPELSYVQLQELQELLSWQLSDYALQDLQV